MAYSPLGPAPVAGDVLGECTLECVVGSGGLATVFRGRTADGTVRAIKVLDPSAVPPEEVKRFTREFSALKDMSHPNIVEVYDAGVSDGYPWISMEFIAGTDLGGLIAQWRTDPPTDRWEQVDRLLRGLCQGLHYVHERGLVHRDVKPGNILVTQDGVPKVSDFGVVTDTESDSFTQLTMAGRLVGTVAFMAPELITDEDVDRRADLYALGAVLYLLCTGRRPIEADSVAGYLARHLTEVPRAAGELNPDVPPRLEQICARLLLKDRSQRFPTASSVLLALDRSEALNQMPLRGRSEVMDHWRQRLDRLNHGEGGVQGWVSAPGLGRSALLEALCDAAQASGVALLAATGDQDDLDSWLERLTSSHSAPLLVVVDDLHLAPTTAVNQIARYLRERVVLEGEAVMLLFTATQDDLALATLISGESTGIAAEIHRLGAIDARASVALIRDRGLTGRVAPLVGRRLHSEYGGHPGDMVAQLEALIDQEWLRSENGGLLPNRPVEDFRRVEFPVPRAVQESLETTLGDLEPLERRIIDLMALVDRACGPALIGRCIEQPDPVPDALRRLALRGSILPEDSGEQQWTLTHPCAARVARGLLTPETRAQLHEKIADALSHRRRGSNALEVARHRTLAGQPALAYPLFLRAAKAAARSGKPAQVLEITDEASVVWTSAKAGLDPEVARRAHRWLCQLRGEALMARARWAEAVTELELASSDAQHEGDSSARARALSALGRAHYRAGAFSQAEPALVEALQVGQSDEPSRAGAARALADLRLRQGRLDESDTLWQEAMDLAVSRGSADGEARALRGLAHLRCVQGRLQDTAELLDRAQVLLEDHGSDRVRAAVLARSVEIEHGAGRYNSAIRRCETLIELARHRALSERLPGAYALLAEVLWALGDDVEARDAAQQSLVFARAQGTSAWAERLDTARVLANLGHWEEASQALPEIVTLPDRLVDDPLAQHAALHARLIARKEPERAAERALWALRRPVPLLAIRGARIATDAARALAQIDEQDQAREACKRGLGLLDGPGANGLRLELLLAMDTARREPRVTEAIRALALRIADALSGPKSFRFRQRPGIERALSRQ